MMCLAAIMSANCWAGSEKIDNSGFIGTATSEELLGEGDSNGHALHAIDGDPETFWHTQWNFPEGEVKEGVHDFPFTYTIDLGATYSINKFDYLPRVGRIAGVIGDYELSVSTDGTNFTPVDSGTWVADNEVKVSSFDTIDAKYVQIVISTANWINGSDEESQPDQYTSVAEFNVYKHSDFSKKIDSSAFVATATSEELLGEGDSNGHALHAIDGNPDTFWHTQWNFPEGEVKEGVHDFPFTFTIDLGATYNINKFDYLPRVGRIAGVIDDYELFVSSDGVSFTSVDAGSWLTSNEIKVSSFPAINASYVQLVIASANWVAGSDDEIQADQYTSAAEFGVYEYSDVEVALYSEQIDSAAFIATATSEELVGEGDNGSAQHAVDGDSDTFWHTQWQFQEGEVKEGVHVFPFTYTIDLGETYSVNKFDYLPRTGRIAGVIGDYELSVSTDGTNFTVVDSSSWVASNDIKVSTFGAIDAKYMQIVISSANMANGPDEESQPDQYASAAEFRVYKASTVKPPEEPVELLEKLDSANFVVTATSEELAGETPPNGSIQAAFDNDIDTFWHTNWTSGTAGFPFVVDIDLGDHYNVERFDYTPRGNGGGQIANYNIAISTDGETYYQVAHGTWSGNDDIKQSAFDSRVARYVRFTASSEANGDTFAAASEFAVFSKTLDSVSQPDVSVKLASDSFSVTSSSEEFVGEGEVNGKVGAAFDSDESTYWHTDWMSGTAEFPFVIDINLEGFYEVNRLDYTPRGNNNGQIGDYEILVSQDGISYTSMASGTWSDNDFIKSVTFPSTLAASVRLVISSQAKEGDFIAAAEFEVFAKSGTPEVLDNITAKLDGLGFIALASSEELSGEGEINGRIGAAFDNDDSTFWHTEWQDQQTPFPHTVLIDLGASYDISQLHYAPRGGNSNGTIGEYDIHVSENCSSFTNMVAVGEWEYNGDTKKVSFEKTRARYVKFTAHSEGAGVNNPWANAAEIEIYHEYAVGSPNPDTGIKPARTLCSFDNIDIPPFVARDVSFDTKYNTQYIGALTSHDGQGEALTYTLGTDVTNGVLVLETNGEFTYTPNEAFSGDDTFSIKVTDVNLNESEAIITIDVAPAPFIIEAPAKYSEGGSLGAFSLFGLISLLGFRRRKS